MNKHTPGPWIAVRGYAYWEVEPQRKGGERKPPYQIADTCSSDPANPDKGLQEANARLIAAAPELLEALENLLKVHEGEGGTQYNAADIVRAAIAKARGEE